MYVLKKREQYHFRNQVYFSLSNFPFTFLKAMMYAHLVSYPPPKKNHRENLKVYATLRGNPRTERGGRRERTWKIDHEPTIKGKNLLTGLMNATQSSLLLISQLITLRNVQLLKSLKSTYCKSKAFSKRNVTE
jgi:hypothetical protein